MIRWSVLWWLASVSVFALEPPRDQTNSRLIEIEPVREWNVSPSGHVWMSPKRLPMVLMEWDGFKWLTHEPPPAPKQRLGAVIREDDQGRIWLWGQMADIFDPHSGQWQSFPEISDAFVAMKDKSVQFIHDEFYNSPQYSADHKRMAYLGWGDGVHYFNGTIWQKWSPAQIAGGEKAYNDPDGAPWFDETGKLCVTLRNKTSWQLDDSGKWSSIPYDPHPSTSIWAGGKQDFHPIIPPEGSVALQPDSISVDNRGVFWMTWKGDLYKAIPGFCVKVFGPDEINPYRTNPHLVGVFVDSQGNAFLTASAGEINRYILKPGSAVPKTTVSLKHRGEDSVVAQFDPHAPGKMMFRWQLDGGPWEMTKIDSLELNHIGNGPHVLGVIATDGELNSDNAPATATFEIKVDSVQQVAALIKQLGDPDFDRRKEAVEALTWQPVQATSALQSARETADDDQRWWIDAALQAIEEQKAAASEKSVPVSNK